MYALHCRPPSGGTHVRRPGFAERLHRRRRRGVAAMVAVMLLAVTAMTMAAAWTIIEHERGSWDRHRMAGQIWAGWVHALARAPEIPDSWTDERWHAVKNLYVAAGLPTDLLPVSGLGADPDDPRDGSSLAYGIPVTNRPMYFSYVEVPPSPDLSCSTIPNVGAPPAPAYECERVGAAIFRPRGGTPAQRLSRLDAMRRGAADGGLGALAVADRSGTLQGARTIVAFEAELERRLSWTFEEGDLVALVHVSIPREERALHRRPPPGRPELAGMQTDLDMGVSPLDVRGQTVEVDRIEDVDNANIRFTATSAPDAPAGSDGPAVRVEEFVVRGSRLHLTSRAEAHGIGTPLVRPGDPEDTSLKTRTGDFATFSVNCLDFPAADERCVRTRDLTARTVRVRGNLGVHSGDGASGSGVTARDTFARDLQALETPEGCHGCIGP